ncbi:MAG: hypothetical protein LLG01_12515 [Planctomycetaceae bacterium]|nr:hypothetical protein [Planctomycetaceae bacterium]
MGRCASCHSGVATTQGGNVALRDDSPAWKIKGFKRIPVEKIGPQSGKQPRVG